MPKGSGLEAIGEVRVDIGVNTTHFDKGVQDAERKTIGFVQRFRQLMKFLILPLAITAGIKRLADLWKQAYKDAEAYKNQLGEIEQASKRALTGAVRDFRLDEATRGQLKALDEQLDRLNAVHAALDSQIKQTSALGELYLNIRQYLDDLIYGEKARDRALLSLNAKAAEAEKTANRIAELEKQRASILNRIADAEARVTREKKRQEILEKARGNITVDMSRVESLLKLLVRQRFGRDL